MKYDKKTEINDDELSAVSGGLENCDCDVWLCGYCHRVHRSPIVRCELCGLSDNIIKIKQSEVPDTSSASS